MVGEMSETFPIELVVGETVEASSVESVKQMAEEFGLKEITIGDAELSPTGLNVVAALNMDMVGRLEDKLVLQGIGSSDAWPRIIERKNVVVGLPLKLSDDTDLPTDATSFYQSGVPILSAFTGSHSDYHTPRDTCLLYTSPSPRDQRGSRMPSSA